MSVANPTPNQDAGTAAYCRHCGRPLREDEKRDVRGMIFCEECLASVVSGHTASPVVGRPIETGAAGSGSPAVAALLGAIPGVGAMYNGQFAKGFAHVVIFTLLIALSSSVGIFGIFIAAFWFYMVIDAYQTAKARLLGLPLPDPFGWWNEIFSGSANAGPVVSPSASSQPTTAPPGRSTDYSTQYVMISHSERDGSHPPVVAIILIALGVLFLLGNMGVISNYILHQFWPALLIAVGIGLFVRNQRAVRGAPIHAPNAAESGPNDNPAQRDPAQESGEQR